MSRLSRFKSLFPLQFAPGFLQWNRGLFVGCPFDCNPGCNLDCNLVAGCAAEGSVPRAGVDREDRLAHARPLHLEPRVVVRGPLRLRVRDQVHVELGGSGAEREVTESGTRLVLPLRREAERLEVLLELLVGAADEALLPVLAGEEEIVRLRRAAHVPGPTLLPPLLEHPLEHGVDRNVERRTGLRRLLAPHGAVERSLQREAPQRPPSPVEVAPARVRRLSGSRATEEAQRVERASVLRDPCIGREAHNLLDGEPGALPPAALLVLDRREVALGFPAGGRVPAHHLALGGVREEHPDRARHVPDGARSDGGAVPLRAVLTEADDPVEKGDLAVVGPEIGDGPRAEVGQEVALHHAVVGLPGPLPGPLAKRKPRLVVEALHGQCAEDLATSSGPVSVATIRSDT